MLLSHRAATIELVFPSDQAEEDEILHPYRGLSTDQLAAQARSFHLTRNALDADEAELLIEVERRRALGTSPFRDTAAWLRQNTGIARSTARTRVEVARQLSILPGAHAELAAGNIGFDHARTLADHANSPNRDQVLDDEIHLVGLARRNPADDFRDELATWARDLDEQREAEMTDHERQRCRRRVTRSRTKDGLRRTVLDLDEETDALFYGAIRDAAAEMQRAERKAKLPPEQQRTFRQLLADAAAEVARRSRAADVITKHRARPTILALTEMSVLWDQLRVRGWCELDDGTKLTAREPRRIACEADIIPMVLDTNGVPLDMGRAVRTATYRQRLALRALHPTCAVEGCDMDFDWCEIHHLKPWDKHGLTDLDNLVPLCSYHHHYVHDWDDPNRGIELLPDRTVRMRRFPMTPARRRRQRRNLQMGSRPPDLVPARG